MDTISRSISHEKVHVEAERATGDVGKWEGGLDWVLQLVFSKQTSDSPIYLKAVPIPKAFQQKLIDWEEYKDPKVCVQMDLNAIISSSSFYP